MVVLCLASRLLASMVALSREAVAACYGYRFDAMLQIFCYCCFLGREPYCKCLSHSAVKPRLILYHVLKEHPLADVVFPDEITLMK